MSSGHHRVADALINQLSKDDDLIVKKIELISYTNNLLEKMVTRFYLNWIRYAPSTYDWVYKTFFYSKSPKTALLKWYKPFFMKKLKQLLLEEQPDLIICTHGFPSFLLNQLKLNDQIDIPVINVYTDFFMNDIWGKECTDLHFVPSQDIKQELLTRFHIPERKIAVTGIPIHSEFYTKSKRRKRSLRKKILVAGGSQGLGNISSLINEVKESAQFDYLVLCGNNQKLYKQILSWGLPHIRPIPYIESRSDMNHIYDEVDGIITKPGGVTISEVLQKKLPIFIHSALPGQEEVNLNYLKKQGLVIELKPDQLIESQLLSILMNPIRMSNLSSHMASYQKGIEVNGAESIALIETVLNKKTYKGKIYALNDRLRASTSFSYMK